MSPFRLFLRVCVVYAFAYTAQVLCPNAFASFFGAYLLTFHLNAGGIIGLALGAYVAWRIK